ncbi:ATP-binding protein [Variovorax sp. dw_954]|uniref:ATP-binding protein n=1 Tax=Variovorax sp. dw_954 TaxID=2720078 RepID=UPI001BD55EF8
MTTRFAAACWSLRLARVASASVVLLGAVVLTGWMSGSASLIQLLPSWPPMPRNVAASFMLIGIGLLALASRGPRWLVGLCAGLVATVSMLRIAEIVLRVDAGINELLGPSYINVGLVRRGGMSPLAVTCFAISAGAMLIAMKQAPHRFAMIMGISGSVVAALGIVAALGFLGGITLAALHTALGLCLLGTGMLALAWRTEGRPAGSPRWLPASAGLAVAMLTAGMWRALVLDGHAPFALLNTVALGGGVLLAPIFALTVYLAQRGHAQAASLRRSEALLAEAQRLSSTGSFSWRVATNMVEYSEQTYRTYDFDPAAPVTLAMIATRIDPDDLHLLEEMIGVARGPGTDLDYEYRLRMADGSVKHLHLVARGTRDRGGLEYIGAIQDVTPRRLAEEALGKVRSELAHVARVSSLGALTASIAHEVNQPLSGILTNAGTCLRMLACDPPNIDGAQETARRTIRDGHRASDVIARLRALFARQPAMTEAVDLNEAIREVLALSRSEMQRQRVIVRAELGTDLAQVSGDRVQLQQVILNLLLNAADAMSELDDRPRHLLIRTVGEGDDAARLDVCDVGTGLDSQSMHRLFEAFYTTKAKGMGIGLSVSRSIIERHEGRLWATQNEGAGATFSFRVPAARRLMPMPAH